MCRLWDESGTQLVCGRRLAATSAAPAARRPRAITAVVVLPPVSGSWAVGVAAATGADRTASLSPWTAVVVGEPDSESIVVDVVVSDTVVVVVGAVVVGVVVDVEGCVVVVVSSGTVVVVVSSGTVVVVSFSHDGSIVLESG
jgi:hypothetical protein